MSRNPLKGAVSRESIRVKRRAFAREQELNTAAEFLPGGPEGTLPAIRVAGCLVFAYVRDGALQVSVDLDDAGRCGFWEGREIIPMELSVQGATVWEGK